VKPALAFGCGLVFALGLGLSGMTQPGKIVAFLDVTGAWDASLLFVMAGAIAAFAPAYAYSRRLRAPRMAPAFVLPADRRIDARLVAGSILFGVGWGVSGFCPGPAIVSVAALSWAALVFVPAMLLGMAVVAFVTRPRGAGAPSASAGETSCG
jgi:uncharacterized membrane protein YedE/YeeE